MSQPVQTLTRAEFVADVAGAMQLAASSDKIVITDDGAPVWVLLNINVLRRLIAGATGLIPEDARPQRTLDDYLHILRRNDKSTAARECASISVETVIALAERIEMPLERLSDALGLAPEALSIANLTRPLYSSAGEAVMGTLRLLLMVEDMVSQSTHPDAMQLDAGKWLGQWLQRPQPALGGRQPMELLNRRAGLAAVARVLGAMASGSFL